jgi:hypothetical protein
MSRAFPKDCQYVKGSARFTNDEKSVIELLYIKNEDKLNPDCQYIAAAFPVGDNLPQYQWILENCDDLDNIHANTYRWIREQRYNYELEVMEIAKREGLIFTSGLADVRSYTTFLTSLFEPFDESKESEMNNLFSIKLELFEMPHIRQNTNNDLKKALRRAATPLEVVRAAINIHLDNVENGIEIVVEDTSDTTQESA